MSDTKTHTLKFNNGARKIAASIVNVPDQFKTIKEVGCAISVLNALESGLNMPTDPSEQNSWAGIDSEVTLNEAQRDLLKDAVNRNASKLPLNIYTQIILTELGLT